MRPFLLIILSILLFSCVSTPQSINQHTVKLASANAFQQKTYLANGFKIFTLQKIQDSNKPIRIYLEGDGKAYINSHLPSINPTPRSYFLVNLMLEDNYPNVIYIARPCQYFDDDNKCEVRYWTLDRFSQDIVEAINEVIKNYSHHKIELVGYSGGGQIALQIASKSNNIINIRTIAGNLDPDKFTQIHNVTSLNYSPVNLAKLGAIPQIHFVGTKDDIVPQEVITSYISQLPKQNCAKIVREDGASHNSGWQENWRHLLKINLPKCI